MKILCSMIVGSVFLFGSLGGCSDRSAPGLQNNANNNANANLNTNSNDNTNHKDDCRNADDCSVAVKYDECCACPMPVSRADMAADPCLLPLDTGEIPEQCRVICPAMPCEQCLDQGRTATCRDGRCEWFEGHCERDEDCVVGIRTDNCCTAAMPVTRHDIQEDQCLASWPLEGGIIPQPCLDQWDPVCGTVDCAPVGPWSRAVACQDAEGGKWCEFVPECDSESDCAVLVDTKACCPCPEPWPVSMKAHDPCLVDPGDAAPAGCAPSNCPEPPCPGCVAVNVECQDHRCRSRQ